MNDIVDLSKAKENKINNEMKDRFITKLGKINKRRLEIDEDKFKKSLELLLKHTRTDTGGGRRCAMFLLSLWNGDDYKADLQALMYTDPDTFEAMAYVLNALYYSNGKLDSYLAEAEIKPVIDLWADTFTN